LAAVIAESLLAALIAPTMMIFQSTAVTEILLGRDAGWQVQRRSDGGVTRKEVYRKFAVPTLFGVAMAASAYAVSLPLLLWMSPVIMGLVLAIPIGLITSTSTRIATLFATPEDNLSPAVLSRARELARMAPIEARAALLELRQNHALLRPHMESLEPPRKSGRIDVDLAIARAKIEQSDTFEEVLANLNARETLAVLKHRVALDQVMRMQRTNACAEV
jgi:membrane glycosyltransferase